MVDFVQFNVHRQRVRQVRLVLRVVSSSLLPVLAPDSTGLQPPFPASCQEWYLNPCCNHRLVSFLLLVLSVAFEYFEAILSPYRFRILQFLVGITILFL